MGILLLAALAASFLAALRMGPLAVIPIAVTGALIAFLLNLEVGGSGLLGVVSIVAAANIGYLAGAAASWLFLRSDKIRSVLATRRFMR